LAAANSTVAALAPVLVAAAVLVAGKPCPGLLLHSAAAAGGAHPHPLHMSAPAAPAPAAAAAALLLAQHWVVLLLMLQQMLTLPLVVRAVLPPVLLWSNASSWSDTKGIPMQ
jgi:hypothetical protein